MRIKMKIKLKLKQGVRGQVKGVRLKSQKRKEACRCQASESGSDPGLVERDRWKAGCV